MKSHGHRGGGGRFSLRQLNITRGAMYLLFAEMGLSLVYLLSNSTAKATLASWLVATPAQVWGELKLWALVTSPLLQNQFISLIFHALILWMFVPVLERWWGTKKFLLFALWTSLAGTITGTLVGLVLGVEAPIAGLDPFIYGSIVAFGVLYSDRPVQFFGVLPLTGKQLMFGIIGFVALFVILGAEWALGAAYAASMVLAWLLTSGKWDPRLWYLRWKHKRVRRHLRVVREKERGDGPGRKNETWVN